MDKHLQARARETIAAPRAKVWKWLTEPDLVEQYFFGTRLEADWRAGGKISFRGTWNEKSYEDKGTILAVDAPNLLRYDYWSNLSGTADIPANYIELEYRLEEQNGRTVVTLTQTGAENEEARAHSEQNWTSVLAELKRHVESAP